MADGFKPQSLDTDLATTMLQSNSAMRQAVATIAAGSATAPATTTLVGGVKKATTVAAIPTPASADAPAVATAFNALLAALKTSGAVT